MFSVNTAAKKITNAFAVPKGSLLICGRSRGPVTSGDPDDQRQCEERPRWHDHDRPRRPPAAQNLVPEQRAEPHQLSNEGDEQEDK